MKVYKMCLKEVPILEIIQCNRCGKEIAITGYESYFHGEMVWGYGSMKDGRADDFDICETCYDEMVHDFLIPIHKKTESIT